MSCSGTVKKIIYSEIIERKWLRVVFLFAVSYLLFSGSFVSEGAEECYEGECGSWQECQYGTMCCLNDNGCPSWDCKNNGCCWFGTETGTGVCRRKKCTSWQCVNPDTLKTCVLKSGQCVSPCNWECAGDWVCPDNENQTAPCSYDTTAECRYCTGDPPIPPCTPTSPATVTLKSPVNGAVLANQPQVTLAWEGLSSWGLNCAGDTVKKYTAQVYSGSNWVDVCTVNHPTTSCVLNADTAANKTYKWRVTADNGARTSTSAEWSFTDNMGVNLTVTIQEVSPYATMCPISPIVRVMPDVTVYITAGGTTYPAKKTDSSGILTTFIKYASPPSMTICVSYSEPETCQIYELKCPGSSTGCVTIEQVPVGTLTQSVVLQLAKVVKDPWFTAVDGDAAAGMFTKLGPCFGKQVSGSFFGGALNLNSLALGSNIYALSVGENSVSSSDDIAEGNGGGFVKNIGSTDPIMEKIALKTLNSAKTLSTIPSIIAPGVYKMSVSDFNAYASGPASKIYSFPYPGCSLTPGGSFWGYTEKMCPYGTYFTGDYTPRVAMVYIDANPSDTITISAPIKKSTTGYLGGHLVLLTRAKVSIPPSLGYTGAISTFNINTDSQIDAVIVSSSGIHLSTDSDSIPMNPIVLNGVLASTKLGSGGASGKGMSLIRDLGINNNTYPGVVVKYPLTLLRDINDFIKNENMNGRETGLETFDVQYEFDKVQEKVN